VALEKQKKESEMIETINNFSFSYALQQNFKASVPNREIDSPSKLNSNLRLKLREPPNSYDGLRISS
jgi:hypothetical protein